MYLSAKETEDKTEFFTNGIIFRIMYVDMNITICSLLVHATVRDNFQLMGPFTNPLEAVDYRIQGSG